MKAVRVRQAAAAGPPALQCDRLYEISLKRGEEGTLRSVRLLDPRARPPRGRSRRCYQALEHRDAPCPGCPAFAGPVSERPRSGVIHSAGDRLRVVTVERLRGDLARVTLRCADDPQLSALLQGRVERIAERGHLSGQERKVLRLLLVGRRAEDIGRVLGIAARTVKFHQANLLEKLGADSRVDLVRLIL